MKISVVIPCGRPDRLTPLIERLFAQQMEGMEIEIVVVSAGPGGEAPTPTVKYVRVADLQPPGRMRNLGAAAASGEMLAFIDDDCLPPRDWLANLARALLATPERGAVGSRVSSLQKGFWNRCADAALFWPSVGVVAVDANLGAAALLVRRQAFDAAGGFDESLRASEDWDFCLRLRERGWHCWFEPSVTVAHDHRRGGLRAILRQAYDSGRLSGLVVQRRHPRQMSLAGRVSLAGGSPLLYAPLIVPLALANTALQSFQAIRHRARDLLLIPFILLARMAYHSGVWRHLRCNGGRALSSACVPAGIVALAFVIRLLGPLREAALGQTDAYAHLQFLQDILDSGRLRHPLYPPGYYWILALPARLLRLDPYHVARYAGAFFGAGMVGTLYALARRTFGRHAACWAAFLAAAFPAFHWLQKTGVGAYPSQLGLLLLPLLLIFWDRTLGGRHRCGWLLLATVALMAGSVPVMLLDLMPFLILDFAVRALLREVKGRAWLIPGGGGLVLAGGLVALSMRGGLKRLARTVGMMAGTTYGDASAGMALWRALGAYALPQQGFPPSPLWAFLALAVGAVLAGFLVTLWRRGPAARMIALWGLLAWAQTVFGLFQFGLYMRAGWPLLLSLAALGGWAIHHVSGRVSTGVRRGLHTALLAGGLVSLIFPPAPHPHLSPAESDLVVTARQLAAWSDGRRLHPDFEWLAAFSDAPTLKVWSRRYAAFPENQGDPLQALLERHGRIELHLLRTPHVGRLSFSACAPHIVLLDDHAHNPGRFGLMRVVAPGLVSAVESRRAKGADMGRQLRRCIDEAERSGWTVVRRRTPRGLDIITLTRDPSGDQSLAPAKQ